MTRERLKDAVEIIGLIAIVASLVFLALEVRQNTTALEAGAARRAERWCAALPLAAAPPAPATLPLAAAPPAPATLPAALPIGARPRETRSAH